MEKEVQGVLNNIGNYLGYGLVVGVTAYKIYKWAMPHIRTLLDRKNDSTVTINNNFDSFPKFKKGSEATYGYFLFCLLEQGKILRMLSEVKGEILREQMEFFSRQVSTINSKAMDVMLSLLNDAGIADIYCSNYFFNYENFLEVCGNEAQILFRRMCKRNHFSESSASDFRDVAIMNSNIIEEEIRNLLRKRYPQKEVIKNFDRMYALCTDVHEALMDSFLRARDIAIEKESEVNVEKIKFEAKIKELTGMDYSLDYSN